MNACSPAVLLIDDGELSDLARILNDLEVGLVHLRRVPLSDAVEPPRRLLIATLSRALALPARLIKGNTPAGPVRIAVPPNEVLHDWEELRDIGFDFMLRQSLPHELVRLFLVRLLYGNLGERSPEPSEGFGFPSVERRRHPREAYSRLVVALQEEATRVAMARNLSRGGLYVEPIQGVSMDDEFRLALYGVQREEPILVRARVIRDEGERGLGLRFVGLDPYATQQVEKLIAALPAAESLRDVGGGQGTRIISKIMPPGSATRTLRTK